MKIFITGGTGFIGSYLTESLLKSGNQVTVLTRREGMKNSPSGPEYIHGDPTQSGDWQKTAARHDGIVNLAGTTIFQRWNKKIKETICQSRVKSARNVVDALIQTDLPRPFIINASAVGYYGFRGDEMLDENSSAGDDFLARVLKAWEAEVIRAEKYEIPSARLRFGIVLGREEGALPQFEMLARYFFGARLGNGEQWISWIHIEDLVRVFHFLIENARMEGVWNATAPHPVQNKILMRTLTDVLGKPSWSPAVPAFLLKIVLGEFGKTLIRGQRVLPRMLDQAGFSYKYPDIQKALVDLYRDEKRPDIINRNKRR